MWLRKNILSDVRVENKTIFVRFSFIYLTNSRFYFVAVSSSSFVFLMNKTVADIRQTSGQVNIFSF